MVPNLLLRVSVLEIIHSMFIFPEEGVIKEARDSDNNIIISYSTLRNILSPNQKYNLSIQSNVWL